MTATTSQERFSFTVTYIITINPKYEKIILNWYKMKCVFYFFYIKYSPPGETLQGKRHFVWPCLTHWWVPMFYQSICTALMVIITVDPSRTVCRCSCHCACICPHAEAVTLSARSLKLLINSSLMCCSHLLSLTGSLLLGGQGAWPCDRCR